MEQTPQSAADGLVQRPTRAALSHSRRPLCRRPLGPPDPFRSGGPGRTTLQIALVNYLEWNLDGTVAAVAAVQILIVGTALLVSDRYARLAQAF